MNLYLILILAFGAVSAAPAAQSRVTNVVHLECGLRSAAACRRFQSGAKAPHPEGRTPESIQHPARRSPLAARRILTGAATPRAPAVS